MSVNRGHKAVVEIWEANPSPAGTWKELLTCGHLHKTPAAAYACGEKRKAGRYVAGKRYRSTRTECAGDWQNFTIHDQEGKRVEYP